MISYQDSKSVEIVPLRSDKLDLWVLLGLGIMATSAVLVITGMSWLFS